jgi:hypothetical protein
MTAAIGNAGLAILFLLPFGFGVLREQQRAAQGGEQGQAAA